MQPAPIPKHRRHRRRPNSGADAPPQVPIAASSSGPSIPLPPPPPKVPQQQQQRRHPADSLPAAGGEDREPKRLRTPVGSIGVAFSGIARQQEVPPPHHQKPLQGRHQDSKPPRQVPAPAAPITTVTAAVETTATSDTNPKKKRRNRHKKSSDNSRDAASAEATEADEEVTGAHGTHTSSAAGASAAESDTEDAPPAIHSVLYDGHITGELFESLSVNPLLKRGLAEGLKYRFMTDVQAQSIPEVMKRNDVFVKAKTGTGKTLAFLIPSIEVLQAEQSGRRSDGLTPMILVLSPTRELAMQIATEGAALTSFLPGFQIVTVVGGTNLNRDQGRLRPGNRVDILVATPGRLIQHFEETAGFIDRCQGVKVLVLDEADRLLDMGFKREIDKINNFLRPKTPAAQAFSANRQTLLFSATFSGEVREVANQTLRRGFTVVNTVRDEEEQTHQHVAQTIVTVPLDRQPFALRTLLEQHMRENKPYKIIVFFPTAKQTAYMATLFNNMGINVLEIHSRKSQSQRTKASDTFRSSSSSVMFSSDVTARGMDYPDVTLVLQVGLTTKEQYIHRIGRTARAGKGGSGMLMCAPFEESAMRKELRELPLNSIPFTAPAGVESQSLQQIAAIQRTSAVVEDASSAWAAWLGFYNSNLRKLGWTTTNLVEVSRQFASSLGLDDIPALQKKTLGKMGLSGVPGLKVMSAADAAKLNSGRGGAGATTGRKHDRHDDQASTGSHGAGHKRGGGGGGGRKH